MHARHRILAILVTAWAAFAAAPRPAAADPDGADADRTLSPYFFVDGGDPGVEALPLRSTSADVRIAGVIADVTVTQVYENRGSKPISARYVFPASTRAAVYGMKMTVGDRVIVAEVRERKQARREYDRAVAAGKTASLLEQDRPNVFSMRVGNILPGDVITVELRYTELLVSTDGEYEFVYPTVVGPRYASARVDADDDHNEFVSAPYTHAGQPPTYAFDLNVSVAAGMPIRALASPSHAIRTAWGPGRREARVQLDPSEALGGNRDFVLRYRLADADLASGMLLYDGGDERFFLMTVQPPPRPPADMVPPREYVFIVDVSGSMSGFPLDTAKALMRDLVAGLRPTDQFDVVLFAGASSVYSDVSVPAARDRIADALAWIDRQGAGGGTELLPALQTAFDLPQPRAGVARTFVVITDGYIAEEPEVFDTIRRRAGDANVFAFGIGDGVNRHLIEGIARAGRGEPFVVDYPGSATAAAARFRDYVAAPVLTDIEIAFDGFDAYDVEPIAPPDVFAQRPLVVFGKWRGTPRGTIRVTGVSGRGRFVDTLDVGQFTPDPRNRALALLWARDRIARLSDYATGDAHRDEVLALGLRYNLLTKYTSFVAVHHVVRAAQAAVPVDQPLPLPAGVSDTAIGVGSEPPLAPLLAALALAAAFVAARRRREAP